MTTVTLKVREENNSAMLVEKNGKLTLKDIDYVCESSNPPAYGVWVSGSGYGTEEDMEQNKNKSATLNFVSGSITTRNCSCITTNGTDKSEKNYINIKGGHLLNENSYGIYMPAFGEINISGGEVQAINMRRGKLNISGGKISKVSYTKEQADKIKDYPRYSGLIWLGDTVAILSGSNGYIKSDGEEIIINKTGGTVEKSFGTDKPFTVYCLDTSEFNQVVKFIGVAREDIKIVSHDEIKAETSDTKYDPKSSTTVFVDGEQIFPEE